MCGIFAYVNYLVDKDREFILSTLLNGLARLEYRGYDSAGLVVDGDDASPLIFKQVGKVKALREKIASAPKLNNSKKFSSHCGMAHTRW
jgi:glucosamine--fructose-6-phosphate aminotransferase (isomerizing)